MVGIRWTCKGPGEDEEFLSSLLPAYSEADTNSVQRQPNEKRNAFLEMVLQKYEEKYPGRTKSWEFKDIPVNASEAQRRKAVKARFKNWFAHRLRTPTANSRKKKDAYMDLTKTKRRELSINAYVRMFDNTKSELEKAFEAYKAECAELSIMPKQFVGFRSEYLAEKLRNESEEVRAAVESYRVAAGDGINGKKLATLRDVATADTEEERLALAKELDRNIGRMIRSMERSTETVEADIGYCAFTILGGPDPKLGGEVHIYAITKGASADGMTFEQFDPKCWQMVCDRFTDFCEMKYPVEDKKKYSLASIVPPISDTAPHTSPSPMVSSTSVASGHEVQERQEVTPSNQERTNSKSIDSQQGTSTEPVDSPASVASSQFNSNIPAIPFVSRGCVPPSPSPPTPTTVQAPTAVVHIQAPTIPEVPAPIPDPDSTSIISSPSPTPAAVSIPDPTPNPDPAPVFEVPASAPANSVLVVPSVPAPQLSPTPSLDSYPKPLSKVASVVEQNPVDSSQLPASRMTRSKQKDTLENEEEDKKVWTYDPAEYLKDVLANHNGVVLVKAFKEYEKVFGVPSSRVKINVDGAPAALKQWASKRGRDVWAEPNKLTSGHSQETLQWYLSLQPDSRSKTWPPTYDHDYDPSKWDNLRKSGPNGLYLVLMSLSWIPSSSGAPDDLENLNLMVNDVIWVMNSLVKHFQENRPLTSGSSRKRKSDAASGAAKRIKSA